MRINLICLILIGALFVGCAATRSDLMGFDAVPDSEKAEATFSGGDGSSIKRAVVITGATDEKTGVRAEYVWLHQHYPGYQLKAQGLRHEQDKSYDEMWIVTADDKSKKVFFDITSFLGKY